MAVSRKTVDGLELLLPTLVGFKSSEVIRYLALANHMYNRRHDCERELLMPVRGCLS